MIFDCLLDVFRAIKFSTFGFPQTASNQKYMKRKSIAYGLSVLLLLVQNSFVFSQTAAPPARSTDELVAFLSDPEAVVVINVKKIIAEVAPTLLNNDAASIEKLRSAMRSIEDETGVNPFVVERIVFGAGIGGADADDPLVILQLNSAAGVAAERMHQNKVAAAKLANEINPLKARASMLSDRVTIGKSPAESGNFAEDEIYTNFEQTRIRAEETLQILENLPTTTANQALSNNLKTDVSSLIEAVNRLQAEYVKRTTGQDFNSRVEALKKQLEQISPNDTQRTAKISDVSKKLRQLEIEHDNFLYETGELRNALSVGVNAPNGDTVLTEVKEKLEKLPAAAPRRTQSLREIQTAVAQLNGKFRILESNVKPENLSPPPPPSPKPPTPDEATAELYALSTDVSRRDETVEGKKVIVSTVTEKFAPNSGKNDKTVETALLVFDDKTLIIGDLMDVTKTLAAKTADDSRSARNLIAKSGDALVAFGVDLRNVNLGETAAFLGEQKNAWQIFGALTSSGSDLSLTATVEKTDVPLNLSPKTENPLERFKVPPVGDNAFADLLELMVKSIVGVEGKLTLRFEKKKAVTMLERAPRVFGNIVNRKSQSEADKK